MNNTAKKQFLKYLIVCLILMFTTPIAFCVENFETECNPESINLSEPTNSVEISVFPKKDCVLPETFNVEINFDANAFRKSANINYSDEILKNYNHKKELPNSNTVKVTCSMKSSGNTPFMSKNTRLFSLKFTPKKSSKIHNATFSIKTEGHSTIEHLNLFSGAAIGENAATSSNCKLTKLIPTEGALVPGFSPDIYEYTIDVPENTKDIYFETEASEGADIKINRHKLKAPGSNTDIYITVKNGRKTGSAAYHILVNRTEKEASDRKSNSKNSLIKSINKISKPKNRSKNPANKKCDVPENYKPKEDSISPKHNENILISSNEDSHYNSKIWFILISAIILIIMMIYSIVKIKKSPKIRKTLNKFFKK